MLQKLVWVDESVPYATSPKRNFTAPISSFISRLVMGQVLALAMNDFSKSSSRPFAFWNVTSLSITALWEYSGPFPRSWSASFAISLGSFMNSVSFKCSALLRGDFILSLIKLAIFSSLYCVAKLSRLVWWSAKNLKNNRLQKWIVEVSDTIRTQAFCGHILLPFSEKVNHKLSNVLYDADSKCAGKYWPWRIEWCVKRLIPTSWSRSHYFWNCQIAV